MNKSVLSDRVSGFGATIFAEMTALANEHQAVNLGQGFPDFAAPDFVKEAAKKAIAENHNQYARGGGDPLLAQVIAKQYGKLWQREIQPMNEVVITVGATEAIFATCQSLLNPGDEVILFEPFYDSYNPSVKMAGARPVFVPLEYQDNDWKFCQKTLENAFSSKTKLIFVNTPHNPTGKIFSKEELIEIANLCKKYDVIAVCDEVYEYIVFDGVQHVSMATLEGMWDRTLTINSSGKTFSTTGWKIGWVVGASHLVHAVLQARQWISFSVATPFQHAIAQSIQLAQQNGYFEELKSSYQDKRDYLISVLKEAGLKPAIPKGTYFVMAEFEDFDNDVEFCRYLTKEIGVAAIPPSSFYSPDHKHLAKKWSRFAFCKKLQTLEQAATRLKKLNPSN